jgi:hypothetical protein
MAKHMREFTDKSVVHCDGPDGNDYTLCGLALEGENGDEPMEETNWRVTCKQCIGTIAYCKAVRSKELQKRPNASGQ